MGWTISKNGGADTSVETLGCSITAIHQLSQQMDICTIMSVGPNEIFAWKDWLVIKLDGNIVFQGLVRKPRPMLMPNAENVQYEVLGPWYYLSNLVFQSVVFSWHSSASATSACPVGTVGRSFTNGASAAQFVECFDQINTTHVFLNISDDILLPGHSPLEPVSWQLNNVVQWAINRFSGSPNLQMAASGSLGGLQDYDALFPPYEEVRDVTCAEVIAKQLRWAPDSVTWFDYSTSPPTFHVARRASLPSVTVPISAISDADMLVITPRYDLLVPKVVIRYERSITVDGNPFVQVFNDAYPASASGVGTDDEFNAVRVTVDLIGQTTHTVSATLNTLPLPASGSLAAAQGFWTLRQGHLSDIPSSAWGVDTVVRTPTNAGETDQGWGYYLVKGQVPAWLDVGAQQLRIDSQYHVVQSLNRSAFQEAKLSDEVVATTLNTGGTDITYSSQIVDQIAEPEPSGLAQQLYNALSTLHYEGEIEVVDQEIIRTLSVGKVLNITGGDAAWASMNAIIQEVELDPETGKVRVKFGVPAHLSVPEMVSLLRVQRSKRAWQSWSMKFGTVPSLLNDTLGTYVHTTKSGVQGGGFHNRLIVSTDVGHSDPVQGVFAESADTVTSVCALGRTNLPSLNLISNASAAGFVLVRLSDASGHGIQLREMVVCDPGTGATGHKLVLCSETY